MPVGLKVEKKDARPKSGKTGGANMVSVLQVSNTFVLFSPLHFVLLLCHSWKDFCIVDAYVSYLVLLLTLPTYTTTALRVTVPTSKGCKATYR